MSLISSQRGVFSKWLLLSRFFVKRVSLKSYFKGNYVKEYHSFLFYIFLPNKSKHFLEKTIFTRYLLQFKLFSHDDNVTIIIIVSISQCVFLDNIIVINILIIILILFFTISKLLPSWLSLISTSFPYISLLLSWSPSSSSILTSIILSRSSSLV